MLSQSIRLASYCTIILHIQSKVILTIAMGPQADVSVVIESGIREANADKLYCSLDHARKQQAVKAEMMQIRAGEPERVSRHSRSVDTRAAVDVRERPRMKWWHVVLRKLGWRARGE